jgi:cbb3-type cytochrome oxidase subunit 3
MAIIQWMQHNSIVLMLAVFLLILVTTYWPGRRSGIEKAGRIPLEDKR